MSNKIWHRALHRRKIWKELSICTKARYYLRPFVEHVFEIWFEPLPFPTILKVIQSVVVLLIALIPLIYPTIFALWTYMEVQYILRSNFGIQYPKQCDLIKYLANVLTFKITDDAHAMFLKLYMERWRFIATAITSSIDYFRMACFLLLGFGE